MKIISNIFLFLNCAYLVCSGFIAMKFISAFSGFKMSMPIGSMVCFVLLAMIAVFTILKEKIANKEIVMILNISVFVFLLVFGTALLIIGCYLPMRQMAF
ncbi:MAG: hypothetical protein KAS87_06155 [Candidatus Omnitrophica bacterium]|nr:hypothetical protein [Candidatus Omnitrophota bacterium]